MGLIAAMGFAIRSTAGSGLPVWRSAEERRRRCLVRPWVMAERGREFGELGFVHELIGSLGFGCR